jgi:phosphoribosylformylglycinamidine cyclo-ligase
VTAGPSGRPDPAVGPSGRPDPTVGPSGRPGPAVGPAGPPDPPGLPGGLSYARSGVDIAAGERAVELIRAAVDRTTRPEVVGGIGGFAGLFDVSKLTSYRRPLLATATDGVGTKVVIAQQLGVYDTIGIDLVAMVVDDLVVCGAEPLFLTDYVVCGRVRPERVAAIVGGVAEGCVLAGCALIGGETAEHPGHLGPDDFDLAGAATGVVEADRLLGPDRVRPGDAVIAMASSGLHSNGFSLVRRVLGQPGAGEGRAAGEGGGAGEALSLDTSPPELGRPLGEELLTPTRIYARDCLALASGCDVHAFAHVTGGGLALNLGRVLPPHADAALDRAAWSPPPVFGWLAERGGIAGEEMERVFNMGVGMVAVVGARDTGAALSLLSSRGVPAWLVGEITQGTGVARLFGQHPA